MSSASIAYLLAADQKQKHRSTSTYSPLRTPKSSFESARSSLSTQPLHAQPQQQQKQSVLKRVAKKVVQHAKEHHQSVNAAYEAYHGPMDLGRQQRGPVKVVQ